MPSRLAGLLALVVVLLAPPVLGRPVQFDMPALSGQQESFARLAQDLGGAFSYKPLRPIGWPDDSLLPFNVAVGATAQASQFNELRSWDKAGAMQIPAVVPAGGVRAALGLPFRLTLEGAFSRIPDTRYRLAGGAVRWLAYDGDLPLPELGVRASHQRLRGVDGLALRSYGIELGLGTDLAVIEPFGAAGLVWTRARAPGIAGLAPERPVLPSISAGVAFTPLPLFKASVSADITGFATTVGARLSLSL